VVTESSESSISKTRKEELAKYAIAGNYKTSMDKIADDLNTFLSIQNARSVVSDDSKVSLVYTYVYPIEDTNNTSRSTSVSSYDDIDFYLFKIENGTTNSLKYALTSSDKRIGEILAIFNDDLNQDISDCPYMQFFCKSLEAYINESVSDWDSLTDADLQYAKTSRSTNSGIVTSGDYSYRAPLKTSVFRGAL
jgi:hypothetical protein